MWSFLSELSEVGVAAKCLSLLATPLVKKQGSGNTAVPYQCISFGMQLPVFPQSDATATINFPLLAIVATIILYTIVYFDYVMFKSTIFGSDYC